MNRILSLFTFLLATVLSQASAQKAACTGIQPAVRTVLDTFYVRAGAVADTGTFIKVWTDSLRVRCTFPKVGPVRVDTLRLTKTDTLNIFHFDTVTVVRVDTVRVPSVPPAPAPPPPPPPPPPPGPPPAAGSARAQCTNEPTGTSWRSERGFDAKKESTWSDRGDPTFSIVQDATAPFSPPNVGQAAYPTGFPAGTGPVATWVIPPTGLRTLYVCFWLKYSPNWVGHVSGTNKILFFSTGANVSGVSNTSRVFAAARGAGSGVLQAEVDFQGMVTGAGHPVSWNGNPNVAPATLTRGSWAKWEVLLVENTPGQFDGQATWWLNGTLVGDYRNVGFTLTSETGAFNTWQQLNWNSTYGGSGGTVASDQFLWLDHLYVSGKP